MRASRPPFSASALALLALAATAPAGASAQDYYTDVRPVLVERCMGCHTEEGIGWSMEDAERTYARRTRIARAVESRRMPPWLAEPGHQEYLHDLSLPDDVIGIVTAWRDAGYPEGEPRPDPDVGTVEYAPFTPDLTVSVLPEGSYLPDQSMSDDYRCFVVDWPAPEDAYVTGFRAVPGELRVAHHVVVHAVEAEMVERFKELDAEEDGKGYECFGGALPGRLGKRAERDAYEARYPEGVRELNDASWWLAHWAPGMDGHVFPEGTGIKMKPGMGLVVQMHYYTGDARGVPDADTDVDFQIASTVERPAFHLPQTHNPWLASEDNESMVVPPGGMATYEVSESLGSLLSYASDITDVPEERIRAFEVYSANLHMHAFGHSGEVTLTDENGRVETLLSIPRWDLDWQRDFVFTHPKVFQRDALDDTSIRVSCTYRNPRDEVVYGGFGSYDEMCFNFSYIAVEAGEPVRASGGGGR